MAKGRGAARQWAYLSHVPDLGSVDLWLAWPVQAGYNSSPLVGGDIGGCLPCTHDDHLTAFDFPQAGARQCRGHTVAESPVGAVWGAAGGGAVVETILWNPLKR